MRVQTGRNFINQLNIRIMTKRNLFEKEKNIVDNWLKTITLDELIHHYTWVKVGEEPDFGTDFPVDVEHALHEIENWVNERLDAMDKVNDLLNK